MKSARVKIQFGAALLFCVAAVAWSGAALVSRAQGPAMMAGEVPPSSLPWRPNGKADKYVGPDACVKCHVEEAAAVHAPMGRALETAAASELLRRHPNLAFTAGPFRYSITRQGERSVYSVTDGVKTVSEPILYAFGQGKAGQTYVFRHAGSFYESRLSFYREVGGLDWTIGYPRAAPARIEEALGRPMSDDEARGCFTCHATGAAEGGRLRLERMRPGVSCEACHGPGADHVAAMLAKDLKDKRIFNPGRMSPDELSQEFCGSCHRSAEQVMATQGLQGVQSVRFQPYRLFTSRGHDPSDPRMSCVACHNPHEAPRTDDAYYDAKCAACHRSAASLQSPRLARSEAGAGRDAKPCPVGRAACATCHMPKVELPGSHFKFTDHRIRVARPGDPFPN
jgi:Zn finger protein HypA/HybF involved in hydrogenase expression